VTSFHRSDWLAVASPIVTLVIVGAGYWTTYWQERGRARATARSVKQLTRAVEDIKQENAQKLAEIQHQNAVLIEQLKSRHQLRLAAIDKRLQVHQEAFELWRLLIAKIHSDDIRSAVQECVEWWEKNCLYLEESARNAFSRAMWSANDHKMLLDLPFRDSATVESVQKNWANIMDAGNIILNAVSLPGLTDAEKEELEQLAPGDKKANGGSAAG
jgi:hypothetical protein